MCGGGESPYLEPGQWEFGVFYRGAVSDKHFQGREPLPGLDAFGPVNRQNQINLDFTYGLSDRWNVSLSLPLHFNSFTLNRVPPGGTGQVQDGTRADGIGDTVVRVRYWVFDTEKFSQRNLAVGVGLKLPSGNAGVTDTIYAREVPVDWSIQLGDRGWGLLTHVEGFWKVSRLTLFGSALYLFNPRDVTGTPAFFPSLSGRPNAPSNSAPDQFSFQWGGFLKLKDGWPVPSLGYRIQGVPISDVFGSSNGFRRPGTIGFLEPGFQMALGSHQLSVSLPVRTYVNIKDSPTSIRPEDATVPDFMFVFSYSRRF